MAHWRSTCDAGADDAGGASGRSGRGCSCAPLGSPAPRSVVRRGSCSAGGARIILDDVLPSTLYSRLLDVALPMLRARAASGQAQRADLRTTLFRHDVVWDAIDHAIQAAGPGVELRDVFIEALPRLSGEAFAGADRAAAAVVLMLGEPPRRASLAPMPPQGKAARQAAADPGRELPWRSNRAARLLPASRLAAHVAAEASGDAGGAAGGASGAGQDACALVLLFGPDSRTAAALRETLPAVSGLSVSGGRRKK